MNNGFKKKLIYYLFVGFIINRLNLHQKLEEVVVLQAFSVLLLSKLVERNVQLILISIVGNSLLVRLLEESGKKILQ